MLRMPALKHDLMLYELSPQPFTVTKLKTSPQFSITFSTRKKLMLPPHLK